MVKKRKKKKRVSARRKWKKVVLLSLSQALLLFCAAMFHQGLHSVCGAKLQTSQAGAATGSWSLGSSYPTCTSSPSASVWSYRWHKLRLPHLVDEQTAWSKSVVPTFWGFLDPLNISDEPWSTPPPPTQSGGVGLSVQLQFDRNCILNCIMAHLFPLWVKNELSVVTSRGLPIIEFCHNTILQMFHN